MKSFLVAALAATAVALPGMGAMKEDLLEKLKQRNAAPAPEPVPEPEADPQLLGGLIGALTKDVKGLLGSVATGTLNPNNLRPEPGFEFIAPGKNDSRGPCPGLNLLANHGYLPRNGYVNAGQILEATSRGFNMGQDLATVLIVFAVLTDGSFKDQAWWLGTNPANGVGGLNRHSTVEADISPNREDFYNGCGDNHHLSSRMFKRNVQIVAKSGRKQFDIRNMAAHFAAQGDYVKKYNPTLYYFPFPMIVSVVAYNFYDRFFSNGTSEFGGVANYESISSIVGAKYLEKTGEFMYVPERFPPYWYRRSFPYTAAQALLEGFTMVYPANPVLPPGIIQFDPVNPSTFNATNLLCELYMGINSLTPLALSGEAADAEERITWAIGMFDKAFKGTLLGCHKNTISKNFFPHPSKLGGPLNPGPVVQGRSGNNVYNKVYFKKAPAPRAC